MIFKRSQEINLLTIIDSQEAFKTTLKTLALTDQSFFTLSFLAYSSS